MLLITNTMTLTILIFKISRKKQSFFLFHMNLLKCTNNVLDVIAGSEIRITKETFLTTNFNMKHCSFKFTSTESSAWNTLFYIATQKD